MSNPQIMPDDATVVEQKRVACDGGGALGHPKTWLDMGTENSVRCKYCDRLFILDADAVRSAH